MKLCSEWLEFSDLTVIEAAYLLIEADLKYIAYRSEQDAAFADYCYERGFAEDASYKCDSLLSALRARQIETTEEHLLPNGDVDCERTRFLKSSFVTWCRDKPHLEVVAEALSPVSPTKITDENKHDVETGGVAEVAAIPPAQATDTADSKTVNVATSAPVWWRIARSEGERWFADCKKTAKAGDPPVKQDSIADHLYEWLYSKGYRGRSNQRISKSSILGQITGIAKRKKDGMGWK